MKTQVLTLTRHVTYRRDIELPAGVELSPEMLDKVSKALNIEIQAHEMNETADLAEIEISQVDDKPHGHQLRLDGERAYLTLFGVERELDLSQV